MYFIFQVRFLLKDNKLVVREVNLEHEFHRSDKQTFDHYPENLRLDKEKLEEAEKLVALGVNKQRLKMYLMRDGSVVPLKTLHNIQTRLNNLFNNGTPENHLLDMLHEMEKIPNARVRVSVNEKDEIIGNFSSQIENEFLYIHFFFL